MSEEKKVTPAVGCWSLLILFLFTHIIGMVIVYYAWNLGVIGFVAASGGEVGLISLKTALGGSLALSLIRRAMGGKAPNILNTLNKE